MEECQIITITQTTDSLYTQPDDNDDDDYYYYYYDSCFNSIIIYQDDHPNIVNQIFWKRKCFIYTLYIKLTGTYNTLAYQGNNLTNELTKESGYPFSVGPPIIILDDYLNHEDCCCVVSLNFEKKLI